VVAAHHLRGRAAVLHFVSGRAGIRPAAAELPMSRILIVDDDPHIVEMLTEALDVHGYEVATATHSLRAYDRAKEFRPDVILMDIMMPYLDGLDQVELLSFDADLAQIPVIVITANPRAAQRRTQTRHKSIVASLEKPFPIEDLIAAIERVLREHRPAA
jgi:CheY-like chemotaxis protein